MDRFEDDRQATKLRDLEVNQVEDWLNDLAPNPTTKTKTLRELRIALAELGVRAGSGPDDESFLAFTRYDEYGWPCDGAFVTINKGARFSWSRDGSHPIADVAGAARKIKQTIEKQHAQDGDSRIRCCHWHFMSGWHVEADVIDIRMHVEKTIVPLDLCWACVLTIQSWLRLLGFDSNTLQVGALAHQACDDTRCIVNDRDAQTRMYKARINNRLARHRKRTRRKSKPCISSPGNNGEQRNNNGHVDLTG